MLFKSVQPVSLLWGEMTIEGTLKRVLFFLFFLFLIFILLLLILLFCLLLLLLLILLFCFSSLVVFLSVVLICLFVV